jgi:hypothetical protein
MAKRPRSRLWSRTRRDFGPKSGLQISVILTSRTDFEGCDGAAKAAILAAVVFPKSLSLSCITKWRRRKIETVRSFSFIAKT